MKPNSVFHDDKSKNGLYLTNNKPYALFYIWEGNKNKRTKKLVTCWVENGVVHYEEHFSDQMRKFYENVSVFPPKCDKLRCNLRDCD